ncbi:hypothetical protein MHYP_G00198770 [Metynnis hypsauchen]
MDPMMITWPILTLAINSDTEGVCAEREAGRLYFSPLLWVTFELRSSFPHKSVNISRSCFTVLLQTRGPKARAQEIIFNFTAHLLNTPVKTGGILHPVLSDSLQL